MKAFVAVAALATVLALPGAMAIVSTEGIVPAEVGVPTFYVADDNSVWHESNACHGLQIAGGESEECGIYAADTLVFAAPAAPEAPSIEVPALPAL